MDCGTKRRTETFVQIGKAWTGTERQMNIPGV